jgi:hypothetical protein
VKLSLPAPKTEEKQRNEWFFVLSVARRSGGSVENSSEAGSTKTREHRRFPRLDCNGSVDLRVLPNGGSETGSLVNLSKHGCCFVADDPLRGVYGSRIELHMRVCGVDLRVVGVIRHMHSRMQAGIEFLDLTDRKSGQIEELMVELAENPPQPAQCNESGSPGAA